MKQKILVIVIIYFYMKRIQYDQVPKRRREKAGGRESKTEIQGRSITINE
jgi:hypothetical protein